MWWTKLCHCMFMTVSLHAHRDKTLNPFPRNAKLPLANFVTNIYPNWYWTISFSCQPFFFVGCLHNRQIDMEYYFFLWQCPLAKRISCRSVSLWSLSSDNQFHSCEWEICTFLFRCNANRLFVLNRRSLHFLFFCEILAIVIYCKQRQWIYDSPLGSQSLLSYSLHVLFVWRLK